ncbi:MAG: FAD-dependent oxidoreductase [Alphaproteobacteria bacterium]
MAVFYPHDRQGFTDSLWSATAVPALDLSPLDGDQDADVAIIGGGFTGLSTALHLTVKGTRVSVLEAGEPGWGASGRNGGQVNPGLKYDLDGLIPLVGREMAERMIPFADDTVDFLFALIDRLGLDCDAGRGGFVYGAHAKSALPVLEAKAARLNARGIQAKILDRDETAAITGTDWYRGGFFDPRGGTLQPLSLARGLAKAAVDAGARIYSQTAAASIRRNGGRWRVTAENGASVTASRVLVCTNGYSDLTGVAGGVARSVVPFYSYQVATEPLSDNILKTLPKQGVGVSETRQILTYYRVDAGGRFLLGARGHLDGSLEAPAFDRAKSRLRELFPHVADAKLDFHWNGRVAVTTDSLPRVFELEDGVFAALGWNGRGVAITTAIGPHLAALLSDDARDDFPLPISPVREIPFHWLRRPAAGLAVTLKDRQDQRERAAG